MRVVESRHFRPVFVLKSYDGIGNTVCDLIHVAAVPNRDAK